MMSSSRLFLVDAFTTTPGRGNPAAVCIVDDASAWIDSAVEEKGGGVSSAPPDPISRYFQSVATELGFSETVFVCRSTTSLHGRNKANAVTNEGLALRSLSYDIRWFSPTREVILCGHATLAATHALVTEVFSSEQREAIQELHFSNNLSGPLSVKVVSSAEHKNPTYQLNFPRRLPKPFEWTPGVDSVVCVHDTLDLDSCKAALSQCLNIPYAAMEDVLLHQGSRKYLLVLRDTYTKTATKHGCDGRSVELPGSNQATGFDLLVSLKPDLTRLYEEFPKVAPLAPLSVTVTTRLMAQQHHEEGNNLLANELQTNKVEVVSRHFAPWVGIPEDPVTGAAHVVLCPYWYERRRLETKDNSTGSSSVVVRCFQASPGRGGYVTATLFEDQPDRIGLSGAAVVVFSGRLRMTVGGHKL